MSPGPGLMPLPSASDLDTLEALYERGRYLDAHELCRRLAPVESWPTAPGLVLAGRLTSQWGDSALSNRLHQRAYRLDPGNLFATYFRIHSIWSKHGVFEALLFVRKILPTLPHVPETREQAYLWQMYASLLGLYRDFTAADPIFERALHAFPNDPWLWVDKAYHLQNQDAYTEALAAEEEALRLQPHYRPGIQSHAHLLHLLERDDEAITRLQAAVTDLQSGSVVQMLVEMLEEKGRLDEVPPLLELANRYQPRADRDDRRWLSSRHCLVARRKGVLTSAQAWARKNGTKYFEVIANKLAAAKDGGRRVLLPVRFVRQHHMTCAPATLTALSHFWNVPADHAEIARQICYDGSSDHVERDWAEKAGWEVREFRATWDIACALIDRGCPFAVVTVEPESAHMQSVIGYDSLMGTLLIRDPYHRNYREWLAGNFFETYASHGPRAMVMVPREKAAILDGLELPDAVLYDRFYDLQRALHAHDRPAADVALEALRHLAATHLLTLWGGYLLTHYDSRLSEALALLIQIRAKYPEDNGWRLTELRLRERLGDQGERRKLLYSAGASRGSLIALRREMAEDQARDAREHPRARKVLRSLLRRDATEPKNLRAYANLLWSLRDFPEATQIYRLAACRADKVEHHWDSYFIACRHLGEAEEALSLLRSRVARWGQASRTDEGFAALEEALRLRPHDGELLLFASEMHARHGREKRSAELLESARNREARVLWLRTAARIADYRRDHGTALALWRELADLNFADTMAHATVARLLAVTAGEAAARDYLRQICERYPHLLPLHQTLVERLRGAPAEEALAAVDRMLALDATEAWALREKSLILRRLRRLPEALACADEAVRIAPQAPASHGVRADILTDMGRITEAHAGYSAGLQLSIDADWLFDSLIAACPDFEARRAAVAFLHAELLRQNSLEHACLQFRSSVRTIATTTELTAMLRSYHEANPDTWASWSALCIHLLEAGEQAQAAAIAQGATERFPLVPRAWTDLANVHAKAGDVAAEIACIEKSLAINPAWGLASRQLSAAYEKLMQLEPAEHALRRAIAANPLEAVNHGWLADVLWRRRQPAEAFIAIETALTLSPAYGWAWDRLDEWGRETGDPGRALRLARQFTESRAGEADSWVRLVRMGFADPDVAVNLEALDRAIQLSPLDPEIWDLRAQLLAENLRYDEALAACQPAAFGETPPFILQGRRAWIDYRRGEVDAAIARLKDVVAAHPDYTWGWSRLTEWHDEKEQFDAVQTCAEKWAWLAPNSAPPHGYLGIAHRQAGRRVEAKASFEKALSLDPQYQYGASELLKMRLEDSDFDGVRLLLKHYATHYSEWAALRAELRLAAATKDRAKARDLLAKFATLPDASRDTLASAVHDLLESGWADEVDTALLPSLFVAETRPHVGEQWIKARQKLGRIGPTFWQLLRLRASPAMKASLVGSYVSWLGEIDHRWDLRLAQLIWRKTLRANPEAWGQTAYALASAGIYRAVISWMRDWRRQTPPPAPWMLSNLVLSYQCVGNHRAALATLEAALAMPPDHVREKLLNWRASEHALAGETDAAELLVSKINAAQQPKYHAVILALTRQMLAVQRALPAERPAVARTARAELDREAREYPHLLKDPALRRVYRRTLRRIGQDAGLLWFRIRSRLPFFQFQSAAEDQKTNTWMWIIAVWIILASMRGCT
jgi:tetratricopeptide (TPR) repeat protein